MKIALVPACRPGGGGGHVVRCLALARALQEEDAACTFVVEPLGADLLMRLGWNGGLVSVDGDEGRLQATVGLGAGAAIVDDYGLDAAFERRLPGTVLAIDDLADRPHACRLLLDSAFGREQADYEVLANGARLLLGPDYALLREGFAGPIRRAPARVDRVLVCFGLSDVSAIAGRAVRRLRPLLPDAAFDIALAADAASLGEIRTLAAQDAGLVVHLDADVAPLMRAADLGVGAGGGMVWERRAAALPQLVVTVAENQRPMAIRLAEAGVIALVDLADPDFEARLTGAFMSLLEPSVRQAQIDNPVARCDGLGAGRVARALLDAVSAHG